MHIREASQKLFTTFLCIYTQFCLRLYSSLHACVQYVHFLVARVITSLHTSFFFIFHLDFPHIVWTWKNDLVPLHFKLNDVIKSVRKALIWQGPVLFHCRWSFSYFFPLLFPSLSLTMKSNTDKAFLDGNNKDKSSRRGTLTQLEFERSNSHCGEKPQLSHWNLGLKTSRSVSKTSKTSITYCILGVQKKVPQNFHFHPLWVSKLLSKGGTQCFQNCTKMVAFAAFRSWEAGGYD